ncbi:MAG TPA: 50S ribosomal protein L6 [Candidatus Poseidoniales archaeon]|nr:50S ribosomal protein L6 [Candidatus Poseidoniales archaeon]
MALIDRIEHLVIIPDGVEAKLSEDGDVTISGENGSQTRNFSHGKVQLLEQGNGLLVRVDLPRRKEKAMAGTWKAHLNNMVKGVTEGFTYRLKAVYSHFPMNLKVESTELVVNNYFGEKVPRRAAFVGDVKVKVVKKTEVVITGHDKEQVGQTAANIERCCTVKKRDRRVFQDGIYLVAKE